MSVLQKGSGCGIVLGAAHTKICMVLLGGKVDTDQKSDGVIDLEVKEWVKAVTGASQSKERGAWVESTGLEESLGKERRAVRCARPTDKKSVGGNELENFIMGRSKRKQTDDGSDMLRKVRQGHSQGTSNRTSRKRKFKCSSNSF